jgi:electron transfer flavoprotein beta subunit
MRKALAMGADRGILVTDPALGGTDAWGTALVLAAALRHVSFDLVLTGMESTDARSGIVPGALAQALNLPALTYASKVVIGDGKVCVNRQISGGYQEIEADLPALVGVLKGVNEPRYPSLKGIMAAKRKEIRRLGLSDLAIGADDVGLAGAKTRVTAATPRPEKTAGQVLTPESPEEAARAIADFLADRKFI